MTDRVQRLLQDFDQLSFAEQSTLFERLAAARRNAWRNRGATEAALPWAQFADGSRGPSLFRSARVEPVEDLARLKMADWPEEDSVDVMLEYIYSHRREAESIDG